MEAEWQALGEVNYHKWTAYEPVWNISNEDFETAICEAACFGGPLALLPRTVLMSMNGLGAAGRICSMNGNEIGSIPTEGAGLVGFGWLDTKELLLVSVYRSGAVHAVTPCGKAPLVGIGSFKVVAGSFSSKVYSLLPEFSDTFVLFSRIFEDCIVFILSSSKVFVLRATGTLISLNSGNPLNGVDEHSVVSFILAGNSSENFSVIISLKSGIVLDVSNEFATKRVVGTSNVPVQKMACSPNGRFLACFGASGMLTVLSRHFDKTVLEFDTKAGVEPLQLCWCGEDAVVLQWRQLGILMVGPYGDWIKFTYNCPVHVIQEVDSLRIISPTQVELLQRIDPSTEAVFRIGSFSPAAMLFDVVDAIACHDPRADENLRTIKEDGVLAQGVLTCIRAAAAEFDLTRQKSLLKAASVGKTFCDKDRDKRECGTAFLLACNALRTLNVVRHHSVAFLLTINQFRELTPKGLVNRLLSQRMHLLALKISTYLRLPLSCKQYILTHWASCKVQSDANVEEQYTFNAIQTKLSPVPGMKYDKLSILALSSGKKHLASLLAHAEPVSLRRILRLLVLREDINALAYSIHSHDGNLILFCILYMWPNSPYSSGAITTPCATTAEKDTLIQLQATFFQTVAKFPIARDTLVRYCQATKNRGTLRAFLDHLRKPLHIARLLVEEAYDSDTMEKRVAKLGAATSMYNSDSQASFYANITVDQIRLLQHQKELESTTGRKCFVDNSLFDTIFNCLILELDKKALLLKDEFKGSESMFYHIKIKALTQRGDWSKLRILATEKRLPVSFLVFAEACMEAGNLQEARYFALLVKDEEDRLEAFLKTKSWDSAIGLAVQLKDLTTLQLIHNNCDDSELQLSIMQHVHRIHSESI